MVAVITGASSGIGKETARLLPQKAGRSSAFRALRATSRALKAFAAISQSRRILTPLFRK